ncbi:MAG: S41 family peptidase [Lachnospiraceae bacterium]|nr:S41 family peptidase [Lachnospiraceae bacterium]
MKGRNRRIMAALLACGMIMLTACSPEALSQVGQAFEAKIDERIETALSERATEENTPQDYEIEEKELVFYILSNEDSGDRLNVAFINGNTDVPYISVEDAKDWMVTINQSMGAEDYELSIEEDGEQVTISRENGYPVVIDCKEDTIDFWDYDAFLASSIKPTLMDIVEYRGIDAEGNAAFFEHSDSSYQRYGEAITIRPGDYGIDLVHGNGKYYIPLQLFSDFFLQSMNIQLLYNGSDAFAIGGGNISLVAEKYYSVEHPDERSEELINFTYKELCLALDSFYGLKESHDITDFHTLFLETDLGRKLVSKDPQEAAQAIADLCHVHLDDMHSGFDGRSWMMDEEPEMRMGPSLERFRADHYRYLDARAEYYPDGCPGYEEVGNTAYITFDGFTYTGTDYYTQEAENDPEDTMGLMIYAYNQITRKDSPVVNVVLDLSNNGGGAATAAAYVIGMILGDASISVKDTLTGALVTQNYKVDANLDRKFDEKDSLINYNLFCLTSPKSFSCGNLVPSALKSSHLVTIIGQTSGGGSCVVHPITTADGVVFQISGPSRLAYMKNGSFYDIDQGVEPDFIIPTPKQFYDREYLTGYINELIGVSD